MSVKKRKTLSSRSRSKESPTHSRYRRVRGVTNRLKTVSPRTYKRKMGKKNSKFRKTLRRVTHYTTNIFDDYESPPTPKIVTKSLRNKWEDDIRV